MRAMVWTMSIDLRSLTTIRLQKRTLRHRLWLRHREISGFFYSSKMSKTREKKKKQQQRSQSRSMTALKKKSLFKMYADVVETTSLAGLQHQYTHGFVHLQFIF